jgi:signal transduction histidine kinase
MFTSLLSFISTKTKSFFSSLHSGIGASIRTKIILFILIFSALPLIAATGFAIIKNHTLRQKNNRAMRLASAQMACEKLVHSFSWHLAHFQEHVRLAYACQNASPQVFQTVLKRLPSELPLADAAWLQESRRLDKTFMWGALPPGLDKALSQVGPDRFSNDIQHTWLRLEDGQCYLWAELSIPASNPKMEMGKVCVLLSLQRFMQKEQPYNVGFPALFSKDGKCLYPSGLNPQQTALLENLLHSSRLSKQVDVSWSELTSDKKSPATVRWIPKLHFIALLSNQPALDKAFLRELTSPHVIVLFAMLVIMLSGVFWFVPKITRPLEELSLGMELFESGLLAEELPSRRNDEIGMLTRNFNRMAKSLRARNDEIHRKNRNLYLLNSALKIITTRQPLPSLLHHVLNLIKERVHIEDLWVYAWDAAKENFGLIASTGTGPKLLESIKPESGHHDIFLQIQSFQRPVCSYDPTQIAGLMPAGQKIPPQEEYWEFYPLLSPTQVEGVLVTRRRLSKPEGVENLSSESLNQICQALGLAFENARLYNSLQEKISALEKVNHNLQDLDQMKNHILHNVSHELRTPVTTIKTYLDLFLSKKIGHLLPIQEEKMAIMRRNVKQLLALVDNLLTVAKGEQIPQDAVEALDLRALIENVVHDMQPLAAEKKLEIVYQGPIDPVWVPGWPLKLKQVFQNLITNAIKFSDHGAITIRLTCTDTPPGTPWKEMFSGRVKGMVEIAISDDGIGISEKDMDKIFQRFYQADNTSTRKYPGAGLGLAIVKEILKNHHTKIAVVSAPQAGSCFRFHLPHLKSTDPACEPPQPCRA